MEKKFGIDKQNNRFFGCTVQLAWLLIVPQLYTVEECKSL